MTKRKQPRPVPKTDSPKSLERVQDHLHTLARTVRMLTDDNATVAYRLNEVDRLLKDYEHRIKILEKHYFESDDDDEDEDEEETEPKAWVICSRCPENCKGLTQWWGMSGWTSRHDKATRFSTKDDAKHVLESLGKPPHKKVVILGR